MFQFQSPSPILFQLGPLTVRWYGLLIALGFLAATYVASKLAKRWDIDSEKMVNAALVGFIGGVIGARLYFVALNWSTFAVNPEDIFATWKGGGSIHGGILGGVLAGVFYVRMNKMPVLTCIDIAGVAIPLGQAIGRWGNFFNSEAFGRPVPPEFPLKLFIPFESRPMAYQNSDFFHPTFLYESLWDFTIFAVLYYLLADKLRRFPGVTFCVYLASYSFGRLLIEMLRVDSIMLFGYPAPILVSICCMIASLICLAFLVKNYLTSARQV